MRVAIQRKLTCYTFRKACIDLSIFFWQFADDIFALTRTFDICELNGISCQEVIQLSDQTFHSRDKLNQTFRNQHSTEVVALSSTIGNDLSNVSYYIVQWHIFRFHFFRDDTYVRLNLQSTFQCNVRSRTAHQFNEVPVFTCRVTVALDVTNHFWVYFTCSIETERSFNHFVLQVTVDSFRTTDHLYTGILGSIVFGQNAGICIRVVTTNDYQCFDTQFIDNLQPLFELFRSFQFGTSRTNNVETTCITVFIDDIGSQFHIIMVNQSTGTQDKAIQLVVFVQCLDTIEQTRDYVMSARSLSSWKDNTYIHSGELDSFTFFEFNQRHSVSVREQFLDSFLIGYWLCSCAFNCFYWAFQRFRKFGLISSPGNLQCTFSHFLYLIFKGVSNSNLKVSQISCFFPNYERKWWFCSLQVCHRADEGHEVYILASAIP